MVNEKREFCVSSLAPRTLDLPTRSSHNNHKILASIEGNTLPHGGIPKVISEQNMPSSRSTRSGKSRAEAPQPGNDADASAQITENIKLLLANDDTDDSDRARRLLAKLRKFPIDFDFNKFGDDLIQQILQKLNVTVSTKAKAKALVTKLKNIVVSGVVYLMLSFSSLVLVSSSDKIVVSPFSQRKSLEKVLRMRI